jgi:hypothetical protein
MNILDHRILIPKSSELVWSQISDLSKNPNWRTDHGSISFLNSRREGVGVRWRYTTPSGKEYVAETVAWYEGLGYEYTLVDGVSYRENKGRIRLQEIPEGTVVQWTFTYEMNSFLGGVRNAIALKRQVENDMIDSLKKLWQILNQSRSEVTHETKSLIREAPNYEARSQYKPRHPSVMAEDLSQLTPISEPPYSEEDTRPGSPTHVDTPVGETEPEFLADLPTEKAAMGIEPSRVPESESESMLETARNEEVSTTAEPVVYAQNPESEPTISLTPQSGLVSDFVTPPPILPEQPVIVVIDVPEELITQTSEEQFVAEIPSGRTPSITTTEAAPQLQEQMSAIDSSKMDTAEISIFDVFGLPKPSETQEMAAVKVAEPSIEILPPPLMRPNSGRYGLRILLRRGRVKLRRPQ